VWLLSFKVRAELLDANGELADQSSVRLFVVAFSSFCSSLLCALVVHCCVASRPLRVNEQDEIQFQIISGEGRLWATHSGDPATQEPCHSPSRKAYHGLARAYVRSSSDYATSLAHRQRLAFIDIDGGRLTRIGTATAQEGLPPIVVTASAPGLKGATLEIPLTDDLAQLPLAVASRPEEANFLPQLG